MLKGTHMNLLLVLEHHFYRDTNGEVWCDRVIDKAFLARYLLAFDNVTVCARMGSIIAVGDRYNKVSGKNVHFLPLPDFNGLGNMLKNSLKIIYVFWANYKKFDCVIFRAPSALSLMLYRICVGRIRTGVEFVMGADRFFLGKNTISRLMNRAVIKEAQNLCLKVNGVSYVTSEHLQKTYPSYSIRFGADDMHFHSHYSSVELQDYNYYKKKWSPSDVPSLFRIIHIGYMDNNRKGQDILLKALRVVINRGINIKATFVGGGPFRKNLVKIVKELKLEESVSFCGSMTNKKDIVDLLKGSHLLVLPSKSEGLPRVIIEAMATSTPCIASNTDGTPELLDSEYLLEYNDVQGLADKIFDLLSDWDRMIYIGQKNYEVSLLYSKCLLDMKRCDFYTRLRNMHY